MSDKNKEIVQKVNDAMLAGKYEVFFDASADNVKWTMVGDKTVNGKENIREWMSSMGNQEPPKFTVDDLIADGDLVAASGDMTMKDKDGKTGDYSFCDIYRFSDGKIIEMNSFVVKTESKGRSSAAK